MPIHTFFKVAVYLTADVFTVSTTPTPSEALSKANSKINKNDCLIASGRYYSGRHCSGSGDVCVSLVYLGTVLSRPVGELGFPLHVEYVDSRASPSYEMFWPERFLSVAILAQFFKLYGFSCISCCCHSRVLRRRAMVLRVHRTAC